MRIKSILNHILKKIRPQTELKYNEHKADETAAGNVCFFTHVPKTGGTSFIVFLDRFYPSHAIHQPQLWWEVGDLKQVRTANYKLFRGHLGGQSNSLLTDQEVDSITLLRDPVKLAYSTYQFVKRIKETALHDLVVKENMSFETFLAHPKTQHLVSDRLIHNYCYGYGVDKDSIQFPVNESTFPELRKQFNQGMKLLSDDAKLELSQQFLEQCRWVGILEQFEHAVRLLCFKMIWPPMGASQKLNTHKSPPVISDKAYELAMKLNKNDMLLYQQAKEKFNKELQEMYQALGVNSSDAAEILDQAIDRHYQENHLQSNMGSLSQEVSFDCSQVLLGNQWHRREWSEIDQKYFRWSGPGLRASLDFWMQPSDYEVTITLLDAINPQIINELSLDIKGKRVNLQHLGKGRSRKLSFKVNTRHFTDKGLLRMTFHCKEVKTHYSVFGFDDSRLVGIALSDISIRPRF
ncbi:hypothetical protein [Marinicella rhabdoformis]|uniref:hypothetical protein n=1 Tax=Marinicella rhabdoformis TaxID=2580566 RepID=UPI0012AEBE36|nr:hypothetical protein [Marinicella rhabdoformis]